jgi:cytosine/adenosine deaminase-related metal-dependent hydrolase
MENRYLLQNCIIADSKNFYGSGEILVSNDKIEAIGRPGELSAELDTGLLKHDLDGRIILPGFVNPHTHLYSSLSPGLSPKAPTASFTDILSNLWWPLDSFHDEETVYYSAVSGIIDAVKHGVTCIFDHHASMNYVKGSLDVIEKAFNLAGIKGVLCFETSNRPSNVPVSAHLDENLNFIKSHQSNARIKGMLGLHANLTISGSILAQASELKSGSDFKVPIHIHCGEDKSDLDFCREAGFQGPVDRLNRYGLITPDSILAHCIHLSERDFEILHEISPFVISNPESNANNRVGKMNRTYISNYLLGTDGMSFDMVASLRSHYLLGKGINEDFRGLHDSFIKNPVSLLDTYFPSTGTIAPGMDADFAVLDYIPNTEITAENLIGHLIFGSRGGKVFMTIAGGNILYKNGEITFTFEKSIKNQIKSAAEKLHRRYNG